MFRRAFPLTVGEYTRTAYPLARDIRPETLRQYVIVADLLERWAGGPVAWADLDEATVSAWLRDYASAAAPATVKSKKGQFLALWRAAADDGLCEDPVARRVRRVRVPEQVVDAWTREEVERLLETCRGLPRWHRCGLRRSVWWDLAVRIAWDSGLRWGDLISLPVASVRPDGAGEWSSSKTGRVAAFRLSGSTREALAASLAACPRLIVCPWPASHETFCDQVERLVAKAGIRTGTWRWIRRGSGSDVEAQQLGAGHEHLANSPAVFDRHYAARSIIGRRAPSPRELLVEPPARGPAPAVPRRGPAGPISGNGSPHTSAG